jgi:hypothetical protein
VLTKAGQIRDILARHDTAIAQLTRGSNPLSTPLPSLPEPPIFQPAPHSSPLGNRHDAAFFLQKAITLPRSPYRSEYSNAIGGSPPLERHGTFNSEPNLRGVSATSRDVIESPSLSLPSMIAQKSIEGEFPDYDLCYQLVDLYFRHVNTWIPLLHRRSTIDLLFEHPPLREEEKILLHAIIATSLRFSTDSRLTGDVRLRQYNSSKERVQLYGLQNSSVRSLQALVILTLDLVGDSNGPPGWNMLALIARSAVQLGLGVEQTSVSISPSHPSIYTLRAMILPEPKDFIEDESRRRLLWAIYLLDRHATIGKFQTLQA